MLPRMTVATSALWCPFVLLATPPEAAYRFSLVGGVCVWLLLLPRLPVLHENMLRALYQMHSLFLSARWWRQQQSTTTQTTIFNLPRRRTTNDERQWHRSLLPPSSPAPLAGMLLCWPLGDFFPVSV